MSLPGEIEGVVVVMQMNPGLSLIVGFALTGAVITTAEAGSDNPWRRGMDVSPGKAATYRPAPSGDLYAPLEDDSTVKATPPPLAPKVGSAAAVVSAVVASFGEYPPTDDGAARDGTGAQPATVDQAPARHQDGAQGAATAATDAQPQQPQVQDPAAYQVAVPAPGFVPYGAPVPGYYYYPAPTSGEYAVPAEAYPPPAPPPWGGW